MHIVTVTFIVKPDRLDAFMPLMLDNARRSLADEPGCHHFDVCQRTDRPNEVFLYEIYQDPEAFNRHKMMRHYLEFSDATDPMVDSKTVQAYRLAGP